MTRLEERQYDRYCNSDNPCQALKDATMKAIVMARTKMGEMLEDPNKLYENAYKIANIYMTAPVNKQKESL